MSVPSPTLAAIDGRQDASGPDRGQLTSAVSFTDIDRSKFKNEIVWMAEAGITSGCAPRRFCPNGTLTRGQLASFVARAKNLPPTNRDFFADDTGSVHEAAINRLAAAGFTSGCGPGRYCPSGRVTRAQLATFFARGFGLPATDRDFFYDDDGISHERTINRLAAAGLTAGCAPGRYCPWGLVTRGQMAAFLYRAMQRPLAVRVNPLDSSVPTTDLPGWKLIFSDDFSTDVPVGSFGVSNGTKWGAYPLGWKDSQGKGAYDARNISVHHGMLDIHMRYEDGLYKVAAAVPRINGANGNNHQLWGRYAARFHVPKAIPGYKLAWLLWPESNVWPGDGEMNYPDQNLRDGAKIFAFMHRMNGTSGADQDAYGTDVPIVGGWHTVVMEWSPNSMKFILDGKVIGHSTSRVPNTPMRWVLQSETELGIPISAIPQSSNGHVYVDWVAVWKYAP